MSGRINNSFLCGPHAADGHNILCLPKDVLRIIFNMLELEDLYSFLQISKKFRSLLIDASQPLTYSMLNDIFEPDGTRKLLTLNFKDIGPRVRQINYHKWQLFKEKQIQKNNLPAETIRKLFIVMMLIAALLIFSATGIQLSVHNGMSPSRATTIWGTAFLLLSAASLLLACIINSEPSEIAKDQQNYLETAKMLLRSEVRKS